MKPGSGVVPLSVIVIVLTLILVPSQAHAHALPVRSDPAQNASLERSPSQVTMWFSEYVNPLASTLKVLDNTGSRVDDGNLQFGSDRVSMYIGLPPLGKGVYTVSWTTVSATDGHSLSGTFPFGVGEVVPPPPSTPPDIQPSILSLLPETLVRWTYYMGQSILVGGSFFYLLVLLPISRHQTAGRNTSRTVKSQQSSLQTIPSLHPPQILTPAVTRRVLIGSLVGAVITVIGTVGLLESQLDSGGFSPNIFLSNTLLGQVAIARLILVGICAVLLILAFRTGRTSVFITLLLPIGLGLLLTASVSGHNAAVQPLPYTFLSVFTDWIHLVGVSVWVGGLVHFAGIIPVLRKESELHNGLLRIVPRFSRVAVLSVGVIIISGLYASLYQIGSLAALVSTEYGQTLLVKMGLTVALVFLGSLNQLYWYPRLTRAARAAGQAIPLLGKTGRRLSRSIRMQVIVGIVLVLIVGVLTALPPAYQINLAQTRPAIQAVSFDQVTGNGDRIVLTIFPFHVGSNSFAIIATDPNGSPIRNIVRVRLDFFDNSGTLSPQQTNATAAPDGSYVAEGGFLGHSGNWRITVTVLPSRASDIIANFDLNIEAYPGLGSAKVDEIPYPGSNNPNSNVNGYDTLVDNTGNVWFSAPFPGVIYEYSPSSRSFQAFQPPNPSSSPGPIAFDKEGRLWYGDNSGGRIAYFDPISQTFSSEFPLMNNPSNNAIIGGLATGDGGAVWVTGFSVGDVTKSHLYEFNSTSSAWIDSRGTLTNSTDLGPVAVDNIGRVWFAASSPASPNTTSSGGHGESIGNGKIEMFDGTSVREFIPPSSSNATAITGIAVAPNGNVWFAEHVTNRISLLKFDRQSNNYTFSQYPITINSNASPWGLTIDSQGNVWFSEHIGNRVGFYDVTNNQFRDWEVSTPAWDAKFPALDQYGNVWFAEGQGGNLAVLALRPSAIGLGSQGSDVSYDIIVAGAMLAVGVVTLRWQKLVRYFSRRKHTVSVESSRKVTRSTGERHTDRDAAEKRG